MSIYNETREELLEYAKWARVPANKAMWYQPLSFYPSNIKNDPMMISIDRALEIDAALAEQKRAHPYEYLCLTEHIVDRRSFVKIAKRLGGPSAGWTRHKVDRLVNCGIAWVSGVIYRAV